MKRICKKNIKTLLLNVVIWVIDVSRFGGSNIRAC